MAMHFSVANFQIILEIDLVEEIGTILEVIKDDPNRFSQFLLFAKIHFNAFDSVSRATLPFVIF